jgi:hypothetical protein
VVDIDERRIVLDGESGRSIHYSAAHLLHMLGVRWYAPGDIGEHVPAKKTLTLETGRIDEAPAFQTRNLHAGPWASRNRTGGPMLAQGHAFHGLMDNGKLFKTNPEYYPIIDGKPFNGQVNLSSAKVVEQFARSLAAEFRKGPTSWAGGKTGAIGPDDGLLLDERPETRAMDAGEVDAILQVPSATDRFVKFVNAVAGKLEKEFPQHTLGFYVYSNHNFPPKSVKPHRAIVPVVAPITFNRYLSIGNANEPSSLLLKDNILAWKALVSRLGVYLYNFNLADTAMPYTRRLAWSKDLPNLVKWGVHDCTIESMDNWHTMVPGNYIVAQLLWNPAADVEAMRTEFYANYYGPAGPAMRDYDTTLEQAYETTQAYAGNLFSMHRILTPKVMSSLEMSLRKAEDAARNDKLIARRVEVARYSLKFAQHWLAMRTALNEFRLAESAKEAEAFLDNYKAATKAHPGFFVTYIEGYFKSFHHRSFVDAGKVAAKGNIVLKLPDEWTTFLDPNRVGKKLGLHLPQTGTANWGKLRTYSASIDEQGLPFFRGNIWYRHDFELPASSGKSLRLWLGGTDDSVHVYLNGKDLGLQSPGNFGPSDVDLTPALNRGGKNTLVLAVDNTSINELGTGGLVRPALIYAPK